MPRVTLVELPARYDEPDEQVERTRSLVRPGSTDLVVLPEAALTGYVSPSLAFDLSCFAEPLDQGIARLVGLARALRCDVVGPIIERDGDRCFNAIVGVNVDGRTWLHYRKRHPWYPETWATPGDNEHPLLTWHGVKLTCAVCFDVHFLPAEAAHVLNQAEVLLFPSAWVERVDSRPQLLGELARQFSLTILNANWGVGVPAVPGQGSSLVVRPSGQVERLGRGHLLSVEL